MRRFVLVLVLVLSLPALAGAGGSSSWPQVGGTPGLTRANAAEHTLSPTSAKRLGEAWRLTEPGGRVSAPPVVSGGVVYGVATGDDTDVLVAVELASGKTLWRAPIEVDSYAMPAVVGDLVLASTIDSQLFAYDRATGLRRWLNVFDAPEVANCAPTIVGDDIYASSGTAVARITTQGKMLWRKQLSSCEPAADEKALYTGAGRMLVKLERATGRRVFGVVLPAPVAALAVSSRTVYLLLATNRNDVWHYTIQARSSRGGSLLWTKKLADSKWVGSQMLTIGHGVVYTVAMDGHLVALKASNGRVRWRVKLEPTASSPAYANGVIYVLDGNGDLLALAASSGRRLWSTHVGAVVPIDPTAPAVAGGTLVVGSEDGLRAYRPH
jgi:outer membrane protein assembly factor BamB